MTGPLVTVVTLATAFGRSEPDLVGFVWLVGFVVTGFLVLARLSQRTVEDVDEEQPTVQGARRRGQSWRESDTPRVDRSDTDSESVRSDRRDSASEPRQPERSDSTSVEHPLAPDGAVGRTPEHPTPRPAVREGTALTPGLLLLNVALTQGLFGALVAGGVWYFGVPLDALGISAEPLSTGVPAVAAGVGFGVVLWVGNELGSGLASASGADYDEGLRELLAPEGPRAWTLLLGATLPVIAVVEELIFRAAVVGATTAAFDTSPWALAVVSALAFALGHGAQGRVGVVVTGALGLALAAGFVLTNSLLVVVVAHYLVNALEFLVHEGLGLPDPVWS